MMKQYCINEGPIDFNDLSTEDMIQLIESVSFKKTLEAKLELIFSYVGFDEEGYLGKNYGEETYYVVNPPIEVCRFIENKKSEEILGYKLSSIGRGVEELDSVKEKKYYLNSYLESITREVNSNPFILDGFACTELHHSISYTDPDWFSAARTGIKPLPFRGAILKGRGVALSKIKHYINDVMDEIISKENQKESLNAQPRL